MQSSNFLLSGIAATTLLIAGCGHHDKPLSATAEDVDQAQHQAQKEIEDARAEASKDIKSAAKVSSQDVAMAKVVGAFDVAMAKADGDHGIATQRCLTLPADQQAACTSQADADYELAKAKAKAARLARMQ